MNDSKNRDMNEIAINLCDQNKRTLIFTHKTNYFPNLKIMKSLRQNVFFTESNEILVKLTSNFEFFDCFILINKNLNNFEKEFFNQLRLRYKKSIIELGKRNDL